MQSGIISLVYTSATEEWLSLCKLDDKSARVLTVILLSRLSDIQYKSKFFLPLSDIANLIG